MRTQKSGRSRRTAHHVTSLKHVPVVGRRRSVRPEEYALMDRLLVKREPLSEGEEEEKPRAPCTKQAASPAQEATRAHILLLENQLRRLGRMRGAGRLDAKGTYQMRCVEEELRKAHSKLKRLLNEAERQRRRRERLRSGPRSTPLLVSSPPAPRDDGIMAALKSCTRFQDFVRELNSMGFSLTQHDPPTSTDEMMPEVDGVKAQIELIEGDEELSPDFKGDSNSQDSIPPGRIHEEDEDYEDQEKEESYRQWFERHTEMQQRWEEGMMREQMEMARGLLESVTTTFLQGVQQVVESVVTAGKKRRRTHFCHPPRPPSSP